MEDEILVWQANDVQCTQYYIIATSINYMSLSKL